MNIKEINSALFKFLDQSKLVESTFKFKGEKSIKKVSLNGYYSKDIIETTISCLFQKGFDNLINSFPYNSTEGVYEIEQKVSEYIGRLKQKLEDFKFNIELKETIDTSILEKRGENFNLSSIKDHVNGYLDYDQFVKMIKNKIDIEIRGIENVKNEIIQRFLNSKSKLDSDFKIDSNIIDKYFPSIFEDLKNLKHFEGNYRDFESLLNGISPKSKIGIKELTSMGTLVNWLISVNLIPEKTKRKIDWKYIAEHLYIIGSKEKLTSSQFSKNATRHHNNEIYSSLKNHEAVIKAHLHQ